MLGSAPSNQVLRRENGTECRMAGSGRFSLRLADNPQNTTRFIRAVLTRQQSGSGSDHMLRRLHGYLRAIAAIDSLEHVDGVVSVFVAVRIISHAATACPHGLVTAPLQAPHIRSRRRPTSPSTLDEQPVSDRQRVHWPLPGAPTSAGGESLLLRRHRRADLFQTRTRPPHHSSVSMARSDRHSTRRYLLPWDLAR